MSSNVLSGLKVVELGEFITAPFCTKMLSDWGAEVIKVEAPKQGDRSRSHGPFPGDKPDIEKSGLYLYLNANKKSVTLNLKDPKGVKLFKELLKDADMFVENHSAKEMKELGLDYDTLKKEFPRLIVTSITPYGVNGPYKDYKGNCINVAAAAGFSSVAGNPDREPLDHPMSYAEYCGGQAGALASVIALFGRDNTGQGQFCDVATYRVLLAWHGCRSVYMWATKGEKSLRGGARGATIFYPATILPCSDGDYSFYSIDYNHFNRLLKVFGSEWTRDERFNPPAVKSGFDLSPYIDELDALMISELENWKKADLFVKCREAKTPFTPVFNIKDMTENPQCKFRNNFVGMPHPAAGNLNYPGAPAQMTESPWKLSGPAPTLGQNNAEIYGKLGYSKEKLDELKKAGVI